MRLICSYCQAAMGELEPYEDERLSHGMCPTCSEHYRRQWRGLDLGEFLDEFDAPILVVGHDRRVITVNKKMEELLGRPARALQGLLGGEATECMYARRPGGCGRTVHCKTCAVRKAVEQARDTGEAVRNVPAHLDRDDGRLQLRISAYPGHDCIRLVIDEVTPVARDAAAPADGVSA